VYSTVTLILGAALLIATTASDSLIQVATGRTVSFLPVVVGIGVGLGFRPLRAWVQRAVDGVLPAREERALFFTDIVRSTELLAQAGDEI
jgi:hypothetical protein